MGHKVKSLLALQDYWLLVKFMNGEEKRYNVGQLFSRFPAFADLKTIAGLFQQVRVDAGGYGICWNDDIDLACEELYRHGESVKNAPQSKPAMY